MKNKYESHDEAWETANPPVLPKWSPVRKRNFTKGPNITVSLRIPKELSVRLHKISKEYGRSLQSIIQEGLDQWAAEHDI